MDLLTDPMVPDFFNTNTKPCGFNNRCINKGMINIPVEQSYSRG